MSLFSTKLKKQADRSPVGQLREELQGLLNENRSEMRTMGGYIGLESLTESQESELMQSVTRWSESLTRIAQDLKLSNESQHVAVEAATSAMASLTDLRSFLQAKVVQPVTETTNLSYVGMEGMADAVSERIAAFESYDETENRNAVLNSVSYNFQAASQNEFGEAFFPTVNITNDNVGAKVSIRLVQVQDDIKRETKGAVANYRRKNIVKALIDNTILKTDMTKIIPVHRSGAEDNFVDSSYTAPVDIVHEGETIKTAPLKIGKQFDLLALSQTDTMLANGLNDVTDSIDPAVDLTHVYVKFQNDKLRFDVRGLAGTNFVYSPQEYDRLQRLNFTTNAVMLNKHTLQIDGSQLSDLAAVKNSDLVVYVRLVMFGQVNVDTGETQVFGTEIKVDRVIDATTGREIALSSSPADGIVTAFGHAKFEGFDLSAYRTNLNRRQRGQLLNVQYYDQIWAVPLRSPVTILSPVNADTQRESSDLAALVATTFARTSNQAVVTLKQTASMLKAHVDMRVGRPISEQNLAPALFGVARFLVDPTYLEETIDVANEINSVKSHEKARDTSAVLVQKIRDVAFRLYRDSGFQAVVDSRAAGVDTNPTIIIGTDPMTARYLMLDGEPRLAGPDFNFKVVTTPDLDVQNMIYIALGYPEQARGQLHPMHFGNMLWSPEVVLNLPISRNGQISRELTVQPRFRHIVNVPVLGVLNVKNLPEAATKVTIIKNKVQP